MRYSDYREKVVKRAKVLKRLKRLRWLFVALAVFFAALTASLLSVSGLVYDKTDCPQTLIFGEELRYEAGAVFNKISYQYAKADSDDWSENLKLRVGEYKVRAVSKTVAGAPRYGAERKFTVLPKNIEVCSYDGGVIYGETPVFTGETVYGDKIICPIYDCEYISFTEARVTPSADGITAVDENGNDVSNCYVFNPVVKTVAVTKRKITVNVFDKTVEYDGNAHASDGYNLDPATTLAGGDSLVCNFTATAVNAGSYRSIPQITVKNGGVDVTEFYQTEINAGELIIEKKPLRATSGNASKTYDGEPLDCKEFKLDAGYAAVKGHTVSVKSANSVTEAGSYDNILTLSVTDGDRDVTGNYSIVCGGGTLEINRRAVTVIPETAERIYDGTLTASVTAVALKNSALPLLSGHIAGAIVVLSQSDVGESIAEISSATVKDENGKDVSKNYNLTYQSGKVITVARPVTVRPKTFEKIYDGVAEVTKSVLGEADSSSDYSIVTGHTVSLTVATAQINVGSGVANIVTATITDAGGRDVTNNYEVSHANGTIKVTRRPVTVTSNDGSWVYDGEVHSEDGCKVESEYGEALVLNHKITVLTYSEITDFGKKSNSITVDIVDDDVSVISNYLVTYKNGSLEIKRRPVTVVAGSIEWVYSGYEVAYFNSFISEETPLVKNHSYGAKVYGSRIDVGESANKIEAGSVIIYNAQFNDVTDNYEITYQDGVIKITKRPVKLKPVNANKKYDGKPLTCTDVENSQQFYTLVEGHTATAETTGSQTEIGRCENSIVAGTVKIYDETRRDVTGNYSVEDYGVGYLDVRYGWTFAYSTESAEKFYDGTPLTCNKYNITENVPENFTVEIKVNGILEECDFYDNEYGEVIRLATGETENTAEVKIFNAQGEDVTHLVDIKADFGTLTVFPRPVTFETNSHVWEYDGAAHFDDGFKVSENSSYKLLENHETKSENPSIIINVGALFNSMDIIISDKNGRFLGRNYEIFIDCGILEITGDDAGNPDTPGGSGGSVSGSLDTSGNIGSPPGGSGNSDGAGKKVAASIYSDSTGEVYLRLMSFGNYEGNSWSKSADYTGRVDGKYGMSYVTGSALSSYGYSKSRMTLKVFSSDYLLPYYLIPDSDESAYRVQTGDVAFQGDTRQNYAVDYYKYNYSDEHGIYLSGKFYTAEAKYRTYVYSKYLAVPQSTRAYMQSVVSENGWSKYDSGIIDEVAGYVKRAARYNLKYNENLDAQPDIAVAFLRDFKEGVCRHYATAATLLFRTLGIPARYTIGYSAETRADTWVDVLGEQAHAWVEVYINGLGWITVEVTGSSSDGWIGMDEWDGSANGSGSGLDKLPEALVIKPVDAAKPYNGVALTPSSVEMTYDLKRLLFAGYTYTCEFRGSRTEVGESAGYVYDFKLYDPFGVLVENVYYDYRAGLLTVTPADKYVTVIHPYGITKIYDGLVQAYDSNDYYVTGVMPSGYTVSADLSRIRLKGTGIVDKSELKQIPVTVRDAYGRDITENCFIVWDTSDLLTVLKRKITVTAASAEKVYDGEPLTESRYFLSSGTLANNQFLEVEVSGVITDVGTADNLISKLGIYGLDNELVTQNYEIILVKGSLTVL